MIRKLCFLLVLFSMSSMSHAYDWYVGASGHYLQDKILSANFKPGGIGALVGAYIKPKVGVELYAMTGLNPYDDDVDINLEHSYSVGALVRLESPETESGGKMFVKLGYGTTELNMDRSGTGEPGKDSFTGFTYGGGVEFNLCKSDRYYVSLDAMSYYSRNDISIGGASLGFRYRF